jgi:hypothetical protein
MTNTALILVIVVAIVAVVGVSAYLARRRANLRSQFGPEYEREVQHAGNARRAEAALQARAKRVTAYHIHPLNRDESIRFSDRWHQVQSRFVDDPAAAVAEADALVTELMTARGYPMSEFDRRAEDLSVDHAGVVDHYRSAHAIAVQHAGQGASTEDLRQAVVHYRALFDDLLDVREPERRRA